MNVKLFATLTHPINSKDLYNELEFYGLNVTDVVSNIYVYGDISADNIQTISYILLKYDVDKITIQK